MIALIGCSSIDTSDPTSVFKAGILALKKGDYATVYKNLNPKKRVGKTVSDLEKEFKGMYIPPLFRAILRLFAKLPSWPKITADAM